VSKVESSITKAGDPLLREMSRTAADQARKVDPQMRQSTNASETAKTPRNASPSGSSS
jgi:hypothetical protein